MKVIGDHFKVVTGDEDVMSKVPEGTNLDTVRLESKYRFNGTLEDLTYMYGQAQYKGTPAAAVYYAVARKAYTNAVSYRLYSVFNSQFHAYVSKLRAGQQDYNLADAIIDFEDDFKSMQTLGYDNLTQLAAICLQILDRVRELSAGPLSRAEIDQIVADVTALERTIPRASA